MTRDDLYAFLAACKLGVISTLSASGSVQSALIGIAITKDIEIIFDTVKSSRKYSNLKNNLSCSLVLGWSGEQTVQYEGVATELEGAELERCQATYFQSWPDGPSRLTWPGIVYFSVRPTWIRYSDFDPTPPFIQEFTSKDLA
jgi:pyridoxine/pyridoxamine 5'-phosphate oxidase